jgi:type I restriction enzyme M protein
MEQAIRNRIKAFLWGIAYDVLLNLVKRGRYPEWILSMAALQRLDAVRLMRVSWGSGPSLPLLP